MLLPQLKLLVLILLVSPAFAIDIVYTYSKPEFRVDGSPLAPVEIKGYVLETTGGIVKNINNPDKLQVKVTTDLTGNFCAKIATIDTYDNQGPWSESVCTLIPEAPRAPEDLAVDM